MLETGSYQQADDEGREYADVDGALKEAGISVADILRDKVMSGMTSADVKILVHDGSGRHVGSVKAHAEVERVA